MTIGAARGQYIAVLSRAAPSIVEVHAVTRDGKVPILTQLDRDRMRYYLEREL